MNEKNHFKYIIAKTCFVLPRILKILQKKYFLDVTKHKTKCLTSYLTPLAGMYAIVKT